jgi:hypothetical protein
LAQSDDWSTLCEVVGPDGSITGVDDFYLANDPMGAYHTGVMLGIVVGGSQSTAAAGWVGGQVVAATKAGREIDVSKAFGNRRIEVITAFLDDTYMGVVVLVTPA